MGKKSEKTGSAKRKASRVKDLSPKGRKAGAVSGGAFDSYKLATEFPTETIRPGEVQSDGSVRRVAEASPRIG